VAILHCYCDESGKKSDHPVVSFSGLCITQSKVKSFDEDWDILLRHYEIDFLHMARASRLSEKQGPKMSRGQTANQRVDALMPFADCINKHFELGLLHCIDIEGFNSLSKNARHKIGSPDDPYFIAFMRGGLEIVDYCHRDDHISIICDDDRETAWDCYRHYRGLCAAREDYRDKIVSLTFADDRYFPALQAADMVAFLARLEAKRIFYGDRYSFGRLFNHLTTEKGVSYAKWKYVFLDKEKLKSLSDMLDKSK
jgi:hypothetical protein